MKKLDCSTSSHIEIHARIRTKYDAIMTASLEQCCKQLKNDTPEARRFIADKLKEAARRGRVGLLAQTEIGEDAVAQLNRADEAGSWRDLFRWAI